MKIFLIVLFFQFVNAFALNAGEIGSIVRTWGSEFRISSSAEFTRADNTALDGGKLQVINTVGDGALVLRPGELTATYESMIIDLPSYNRLVMSWNADTPPDTWVEVLGRSGVIAEDGSISWLTDYLTFGRWSPFSLDFNQMIRSSVTTSGPNRMNVDIIETNPVSNVAQVRVILHRNMANISSPVLRQLHGTLRNTIAGQAIVKEYPEFEFPRSHTGIFPTEENIDAFLKTRPIEEDRMISLMNHPAYIGHNFAPGTGLFINDMAQFSQQQRGPVEGGVICSATSIAMILEGLSAREGRPFNRLVEEYSIHLFDYTYNGYGNWAYTVALAGTYGFNAYVEYSDKITAETIKRHLLSDHVLAMSVTYSGTATDPHFITRPIGISGTTAGHLITIMGIVWRDGREYVISLDSWSNPAPNNAENRIENWNEVVYREVPMDEFLNILRHTTTQAAMYIVKPGFENGAGTHLPIRRHADLIEIAPGVFEIAYNGERIPIDASVRPRPNGYIAFTTEEYPVFSGRNPTAFGYLPISNTVTLGTGVGNTGTGQIFNEAVLDHPNFKMYVIMGNGYTYTLDYRSVPSQRDLASLQSINNIFDVNNTTSIIRPGSRPVPFSGPVSELNASLIADRGGEFKIFPAGAVINSPASFRNTPAKAPGTTLVLGDFIVVLSASGNVIRHYALNPLTFERSAVMGSDVNLAGRDFPFINRLGSFSGDTFSPISGPGVMVTYTVTGSSVRVVDPVIPGLNNGFIDTLGMFPANPESAYLVAIAGGQSIVTATVSGGELDGLSASFSVNVETGAASVMTGFRWGSFEGPRIGGTVQNNSFITGTGQGAGSTSNGPWAYIPHPDDPFYFSYGRTWNGGVYSSANAARIDWFKDSISTENLLPNGYVFSAGNVYIAKIVFATAAYNNTTSAFWTPQNQNAWNTFVTNIEGLPGAGAGGVSGVEVSRGQVGNAGTSASGWNTSNTGVNWCFTVTIVYQPL
ncbi:MAG: C39 family peptidase [Treponema sp.]|nr:C39 family peptidase [Treponema sp.]